MKDLKKVLVTGSSGYVASDLIKRMIPDYEIFGIDMNPSEYTNIQLCIGDKSLNKYLKKDNFKFEYVINLAAARFDFGASPSEYFELNVKSHEKFLNSINSCHIKKFIHVSSVAALDGRNITYSEDLECDDAYRVTKYLQETIIQEWCDKNNIELTVLYPSAIFSDDPRSDTNIGKLQSISKIIPIIPKIEVVKSLTYLPNFSQFIIDLIGNKITSGKYLTIEQPSLNVSNIIKIVSGRSINIVKIPFLKAILKTLANFMHIIGFFGKIDMKLTPNRVVKLFKNTSYAHIDPKDIDISRYRAQSHETLPKILAKYKK
ncbi:NAD(P)-dependent oxidoreductase [Gammaproteobacteria bacterium]|nr:NAD(P)-dependent oxidoreductase [Gammaproteobacteria bacterium]